MITIPYSNHLQNLTKYERWQSKSKKLHYLRYFYIVFLFYHGFRLFFKPRNIFNYFKKNEFFDTELFQTRNNLINENIRLKNEVLELRKLKIENDLLKEELDANKNLIESVDSTNYFYIKTTAFIKNNENKYLVSGGYDKNFEKNDIVINEEGFVVGFVDKIFQNHSEIVFLDDVDFSMPGLDRFGNEYLIQNNGSQLSVYTTSVNELTANIDFIFTASIFDQPGRFPIVSLSDAKITVDDNKISSNIDIEEISFTFTDIYIVKTNDLP